MSMEIRQSTLDINTTVPKDFPTGIKIGPGEKVLAVWCTPADSVLFGGYRTVFPGLSEAKDELLLGIKPGTQQPEGSPMKVLVTAIVDSR